jgi:hypothetical protein
LITDAFGASVINMVVRIASNRMGAALLAVAPAQNVAEVMGPPTNPQV